MWRTSEVVVDVVVVVFSLVENGVDDVVVKEVVVAFNVVMLTNQNVCNVVVVNIVSSTFGASSSIFDGGSSSTFIGSSS